MPLLKACTMFLSPVRGVSLNPSPLSRVYLCCHASANDRVQVRAYDMVISAIFILLMLLLTVVVFVLS